MDHFNIVFVDDEVELVHLYKLAFHSEITDGICTVNTFESAKDCLKYFQNSLPSNVILLTDVNMPEMNGFEFLQKAAQDCKGIIGTYVISGYGTHEYTDIATKLGVKKFFFKPVSIFEIKKELKNDFGVMLETQ